MATADEKDADKKHRFYAMTIPLQQLIMYL